MRTLIQSLFHAGLDAQKIKTLLPEAQEENGHYLTIYSSMITVIFAVCLLVSVLAGGKLVVNRPIYIAMIAIGMALYLAARLVLPRQPLMSTIFATAFIIALYAYSFTVSLLHPDMQGVAAVAILLVMPSLFNYRPIYMIVMTIAAQVVYCVLSAIYKEKAIALLDLWNCLFFGSIAVLLAVFQMRVKFRLLQQKQENRYLSQTDLLTGAKNRNCFEERRDEYAQKCRERVCCIFVDANGLHELNDAQGHEVGDEMLQTVARAVIESYGTEDTFRIGGDEFVAFCLDEPIESVYDRIRGIEEAVAKAGYSISVGVACHGRFELNMRQLVKEAEKYMYREKRRYYEQSSHDRRKRVQEPAPEG